MLTRKEIVRAVVLAMPDRLDVRPATYEVRAAAIEAMRLASCALDRLHEQACNGVPDPARVGCMKWDDADQARNDRLCARHMGRIVEAVRSLVGDRAFARLRFVEQGDPRGLPIQIYLDGAKSPQWTF